MSLKIIQAKPTHAKYAKAICQLLENSAKERGTGIAKRTEEYIIKKINAEDAVLAFDKDRLVGFSYIESWSHGKFVANSGLVIDPEYRGHGLGKNVKKRIFELSVEKYPNSKIFGITTSNAVLKINHELGYKPVTFSELTEDDSFWTGCSSCKNFDILTRNARQMCLCTGMLYEPKEKKPKEKKQLIKTIAKRILKIKS